jgi:alkaline phosphatase D
MNTTVSRRRMLQVAYASALLSFARPTHSQIAQRLRFTQEPFMLGVASGCPRPTSVVLWTRLAPEPAAADGQGGMPPQDVPVRWEIAKDEAFARKVMDGQVMALASNAHAVHAQVNELEPGTTYYYRFIAGNAQSPTGRTRTAPAASAQPAALQLALASCQHYEGGFYPAWREVAGRDLDFVLFVGDYIYENNYGRQARVRDHDSNEEVKTLAQYRKRYAHYRLDDDLKAAHAAHPWIVTWDDHEVQNDYANDRAQDLTPPQEFLQRRAAAYKAYFEHMPLAAAAAPQESAMRLYDQYTFGDLLELWTLDGRQYRSPQACPRPDRAGGSIITACSERERPERTLLGTAQERWLMNGLRASQRGWKVLAQQTLMASTSAITPLGRAYWSDGWDGYPAARERLLSHIADQKIADVVSLGGDVHMHVAADLKLDFTNDSSPVVASEFVCTSISSRGRDMALWQPVLQSNPHLKHLRSDERGYALLEFTPKGCVCTFRSTPHPARADAQLSTQAVYAVERGKPGVQPLG